MSRSTSKSDYLARYFLPGLVRPRGPSNLSEKRPAFQPLRAMLDVGNGLVNGHFLKPLNSPYRQTPTQRITVDDGVHNPLHFAQNRALARRFARALPVGPSRSPGAHEATGRAWPGRGTAMKSASAATAGSGAFACFARSSFRSAGLRDWSSNRPKSVRHFTYSLSACTTPCGDL